MILFNVANIFFTQGRFFNAKGLFEVRWLQNLRFLLWQKAFKQLRHPEIVFLSKNFGIPELQESFFG